MKKSIIIVMLSALFFIGSQDNNSHQRRTKSNKNYRMIERLKLSEDQERQFLALKFAKEEKEIDIQSQLRKNRLKMTRLTTNDEFRKEDLFTLIDSGGELTSKLAKINTEFWFDVKDILNRDQLIIWKDMINRVARITKDKNKGNRRDKRGFRREFRRMKD